MNHIAIELNEALDKSVAGPLLSSLGRRLFFPRGIIAQAAEAKKTAKVNATLGMAFQEKKPLALSSLMKHLPGLTPEEAVAYAPTAGVEPFRQAWKAELIRKNPSLQERDFSLPVVVPGITAGISYIADLFLDKGQTILTCEPCWDNYSLIFTERREAVLKEVPVFTPNMPGFNVTAFEKAVKTEAATGQVRIILNFPQNPSGYTLHEPEAAALTDCIKECAEGGASVLVICDDAYFGLFYEEGIINESLFSRFVNLHEKVLAVKIDGPTKEDFGWGLRTGFISIGSRGLDESAAAALEKKLMGAIRSSVSCANTPAQYLTLKTWGDPGAAADKKTFYTLLCSRYQAVKRFIKENPVPSALELLPFNSGYFMCFHVPKGAENLRLALLKKGIGTIALEDEYLRVTFAAIEEEEIPGVYRIIYETAVELESG
jgi:aspartate/methionine/tyrosine aminotransferase